MTWNQNNCHAGKILEFKVKRKVKSWSTDQVAIAIGDSKEWESVKKNIWGRSEIFTSIFKQ